MWKRAKQDLPHAQMASVGLMPPRQMGQVVLSRPPARYCCTRRRPFANKASLWWQPEVAGHHAFVVLARQQQQQRDEKQQQEQGMVCVHVLTGLA